LADAKLQVAALQITSDTNNNSLSGGTNNAIDIDNPANLGQESTDAGNVKNLK
jgi:oxalate decarboxylase